MTLRSVKTPLLEVSGLCTTFGAGDTSVPAVRDVGFTINKGEILGLVGESGSGKSVTLRSVLGLSRRYGRTTGSALWRGENLVTLPESDMRRIRGGEIAMIFQEPMTSLNPLLTVGVQIDETLKAHTDMSAGERKKRAIEMLDVVGIPAAGSRLSEYPHQFSGGMRQRVMIAIALAARPKLLLADEPTTALDVTIQAQILDLLRELQRDRGMGTMLITHDLGVVAEYSDVVCVMYAGRVVEYATVHELYENPLHPYTRGLFASIPKIDDRRERLRTVSEVVENEREFEGLTFDGAPVRPWWPWHDRPAAVQLSSQFTDDYELVEIKKDHWVGVWRTEPVIHATHRVRDLSYRLLEDPVAP